MTDDAARAAAREKAQQAAAQRREREANWKRLILVGTLAGFSAFFGIVAVQDTPADAVAPVLENADDQPRQVVVPRVRTRTS